MKEDIYNKMEFNKGNLSTIAGWVYMIISPILVKFGFELDQSGFTSIFVGVVGLIVLVYSAKHPNQFDILDNTPQTCEVCECSTNETTKPIADIGSDSDDIA